MTPRPGEDRLSSLPVPAPSYDRAAVTTGIVHLGGGFPRAPEPTSVLGLVVEALARRRCRRDPELGAWVRRHVAFPSSMVDRITPVTTESDRAAVVGVQLVDDVHPYESCRADTGADAAVRAVLAAPLRVLLAPVYAPA